MRAVFTDLDGSLRHSQHGFHAQDREALLRLGAQGIIRVVATGRSLFAARKVLTPGFPIDYLIFSSGAGILDWHSQRLMHRDGLSPAETGTAVACLQSLDLDFMLHAPVPENHYFWYDRPAGEPDFTRRLALYQDYARPLAELGGVWPADCSQLLAIVPGARTAALHTELARALPQLSVIRATSPLDEASGWLEIFPGRVSKSQAAAWLARAQGYSLTLGFGNDYNDLDLLDWCDRSFVTVTAPRELLQVYESVNCPAGAGFAQAIARWLAEAH